MLQASIIRYRGDNEALIGWMQWLPKRYTKQNMESLIERLENTKQTLILWTKEDGIKIVKLWQS